MANAFDAIRAAMPDRGAGGLPRLILALVLAGAILLLPACNSFVPAGYSVVGDEGGSVVDPDQTQITLTSAIAGVQARLITLPRLDFLEGKVADEYHAAAGNLPGHLRIKSPVYHLKLRNGAGLPIAPGGEAELVALTIPVPNDAEPLNALSLYEWTGKGWRFIPSHLIAEDDVIEAHLDYIPGPVAVFHQEPVVPVVAADVDAGSHLDAMLQAVTELNPVGLYLLSDGSLGGELTADLAGLPEGVRVVPVVRNWGADGVIRTDFTDNMLAIQETRSAHIEALAALLTESGFAGVEIEYRDINPELREQLTEFARLLAARLHADGMSLGLRVPLPIQIAEDRWVTGAYDWRALGQHVDRLTVPAMPDLDAYAEGGKLVTMLQWAAGEVERYRLHVSLPLLSRVQVQNYVLYRPYDEILRSFGTVEVGRDGDLAPDEELEVRISGIREWSGLQFDQKTRTHWFTYKDTGNVEHVVQLEDARSLAYKLALIGSSRLRGVAITGCDAHPTYWDVLADFRDLVISEPDEVVALALYLADDSGGKQSQELGAGGAWQMRAPAEAGSYSLSAAMSIGNRLAIAGPAAALAVAEATATPTPTPLPTETPVPTVTPTAPPTNTPAPAGPPTATPEQAEVPPTATPAPQVAAPPPSGGGAFGYGLQAHMIHNDEAPWAMTVLQDMGFNWIKQQIEWKIFEPSQGAIDWGSMDYIVNHANGAGVGVLFSVVGAPSWAREPGYDASVTGPPADPQTFANFLGQMAGRFCGSSLRAIEVWNEQNLHYEWGNKPISPAEYMNLLKPAYASIKGACPSMRVIAGALTPTGAPAPWAMDDFAYLEGMYQNGLKNYADGIGAHPSGFNVAPDIGWQDACNFITQRESSFRGPCNSPHHSWSFRATMEGYRNIMVKYGDGNKRIWPTEFGWAAGGAYHGDYGYANDNSFEDQAQWTARAYEMMRNWGWVGPAFLWNLNFRVIADGTEKAQWGIVDNGRGPLPVYAALKGMPK